MTDPNRYWDEWRHCANVTARACLLVGAVIAGLAGLLWAVTQYAGHLM